MAAISPTQLADWFDAHAAHLVLYARQWVAAPTAEDLVQEVFLKLAAQPAAPQNVKAWLLVSLRHAALDALKTARRRHQRDQRAGEQRSHLFVDSNPSASLDAAEVQKALEGLPAAEREVITLRIWAEATFEEIARVTGTPLSTVYQQYRSGLEAIRSRWESPCPKK
ncbi:MAG TPA: RNA polymerase sigma factor [Phycisphaerae bacterium]|nr:RNA polymerase sigma factor [Phycisphaerae bacterium]